MAQKYTWKQGDNLFDLAEKYNTTSAAILSANPGLRQPLPGIVLTIPGGVTTLAGDPKGPWTPDLPTPDPKDPYAVTPTPPPPLPDWFPTKPTVPPTPGVPDPKGPYTPDLPTPPPGVTVPPVVPPPALPRLEPSRPGLPTLPPLEPSRVGAPPGEAYRSPTLIDPRANIPALQPGYVRPTARQPFDWTRPIFPAGAPITRGITPGIDWINLLGWGSQAGESGRLRRIIENNPQLANRLLANLNEYRPAAGLEPSRAGGVPSPTTYSQLITQGMDPNEAARVIATNLSQYADPTTGPPGGPIFPMGEGGWPDIGGPEPLRSSIIEHYLDRGLLPLIFFREDIVRLGITEAELIAAGYVKDQFGDWIRGGMTPAEVERAAETGGGGYSRPTYTAAGRRAAPRGGGGARAYPQYGGGGGGITFNFPQGIRSFVSQQQRGVSPTGRNTRPARFGTVNWRI